MDKTYQAMTKCKPHPPSTVGARFDELLIAMAIAGNRDAGERLAFRWHPRLLRAARRLTGDRELALCAAQETWVAIWRGLATLRDHARFGPWAFGILRRKCADAIARRSLDRARDGGDNAKVAASGRIGDAAALAQAFAMLTPDHRLAAHLFFVEGFTLVEIAEVQGVPLGTAKSRLFHARRQLKAALADHTDGDDQ